MTHIVFITPIGKCFLSIPPLRGTVHQILIVHWQNVFTSSPRPHYTHSHNDCHTHRSPPHSLTATHSTCSSILSYFQKRNNNTYKHRWSFFFFQNETTLMSSLQSDDLTTTIVWARFSYHYLSNRRQLHATRWQPPFQIVNLQQIAMQRGKAHCTELDWIR